MINMTFFNGIILLIQQQTEKGNDPNPKHGFSSPGHDSGKLQTHRFPRAARPQRIPRTIESRDQGNSKMAFASAIERSQLFIRRGRRRINRIHGQVICLLWVGLRAVWATGNFEVEGTVDYKFYREGSGGISRSTNWFRAVVQDCKSKIRAGGMEDERIDYFEYSCDGTNSSFLINYLSPANASSPLRILNANADDRGTANVSVRESNINDAHLILNQGPVPEYIYGQITPVWVAYGSRCFYENAGTNQIEPVFFRGRGVRENGLKFKSSWRLSLHGPGLLEWMCDFYDGKRYGMDQDAFVVETLAAPFDQDMTNTVYSVLAWTNVDRQTIPSNWQVLRYRRNLSSQRMELESETVGSLLSARTQSEASNFTPEFPKRTRITDKTVGSFGGKLSKFSYMTLEGKIKNAHELKSDFQFQVASAVANKAPLSSTSMVQKRTAIFLLMLLILGVPVAVLIWRRMATASRK